MTGDMLTLTKVVILLQIVSYLALVNGNGEFIRERLDRLEKKLSEDKAILNTRLAKDIAFLEMRFAEDIALVETRLAEDMALLRRELDQSNDRCTNPEVRVPDCYEWHRLGHTTNGVYTVFPNSTSNPLKVYCDMETDGGGWTVFQRRMDGSVDFYRNWMNYTLGFGNLSGEFWLGNENVHRLTANASCELRIDMEDFENQTRVAKYGLFSIGNESKGFVLSVQGFTGNANDSLTKEHNNREFSTYDAGPSSKCAKDYKGAWWYGYCHSSNLNGLYHKGEHTSYADGVNWYGWKGYYYSLKKTEMKFRPT